MTQNKHISNKKKQSENITCLIPFYNEDERIIKTVQLISTIPEIDSIVCVDDCSSDQRYTQLAKQFPQITVLRLEENQGKSGAVRHGLSAITTPRVLLLDADLQQLQETEISRAVATVKNDPSLDMLILRRSNYAPFVTAIRHDILMSGERILRTDDLKAVFKKPPTGYQLEVAINDYMMKHNKRCFWQQTSLKNSYKIEKWSFKEAIKKYKDELTGYTSYNGPLRYISQVLTFCKHEYRSL